MHDVIKQLLNGQSVKWETIEYVFDIMAGGDVPKEAFSETKTDEYSVPILSNGIDEKALYGWTNKAKITKPSLTVSARGTIGWVSYRDKPFFPIVRLLVLTPKIKLNLKYAFHFMKMIEKDYKVPESGIPQLTKPMIKDILIPIPPLPVQQKIAQMLDKLTSLTAELIDDLMSENNLRVKQYQYYRDKLLSENELAKVGFEYQPLGQILVRTKGTKITASQMKELHKENAPIKIFAGGKTVAFVDFDDIPSKDVNYNPSIIVKSRGIIEFEYYDKPFSHKNEMWSYYADNDHICLKFIYHYLKLNESHFQQLGSKMQMPQIATPDTDKFLVPIPPLPEQIRIVEILDKFETLTHSITEGLPKEIELRQKQYEYYRALLLGFDK